jgi:hypothetical protein
MKEQSQTGMPDNVPFRERPSPMSSRPVIRKYDLVVHFSGRNHRGSGNHSHEPKIDPPHPTQKMTPIPEGGSDCERDAI